MKPGSDPRFFLDSVITSFQIANTVDLQESSGRSSCLRGTGLQQWGLARYSEYVDLTPFVLDFWKMFRVMQQRLDLRLESMCLS